MKKSMQIATASPDKVSEKARPRQLRQTPSSELSAKNRKPILTERTNLDESIHNKSATTQIFADLNLQLSYLDSSLVNLKLKQDEYF